MRKVMLPLAAVCLLLPSFAFAQTSPEPGLPAPAIAPPPERPVTSPDQPLLAPSPTAGLNKTARDGVSTVTVPAVPCSTSARGTDGTTTCVGIPGPTDAPRTTGTAR